MVTRVSAEPLAGRYRVEARLASGGMGEVWRARDEHLGRPVALKLLRADLAEDPVARERFRREARLAAAVIHPNVAALLDVVHDGHLGIVMELVEGETLAEHLRRRGALPLDQALAVAEGLLAALEAAHAAGVVHRDVTPRNVMLGNDGRVKVTDFGIARAVAEETRLTDSGAVIGTAHYLAPEQLRGEEATPASDQYAAALVIYEVLAGRRPFAGETPAAAALARLERPPVPLRRLRPDIPPAVAEAVMRALEPDPRRRHPSVAAFRVALHVAAGAEGGPASGEVPTLPVRGGGRGRDGGGRGGRGGDTQPLDVAGAGDVTGSRVPPEARVGRRLRPPAALAVPAVLGVLALGVPATVVAVTRLLSGNPGTVEVPTLVGRKVEAVRGELDDLGFAVAVERVAARAPAGTVVAQSIAPGLRVEAGSPLVLRVASGRAPCCRVPPVVGLRFDVARHRLEDAGLRVGPAFSRESAFPSGTVLEQQPGPSATLPEGSAVAVVIAAEPDAEDDDEKDDGDDDEGQDGRDRDGPGKGGHGRGHGGDE